MKRKLKVTAVIATSVVLALVAIFWILASQVLPGVVRDQARQTAEEIGYRFEIGSIEIEPMALRARLNDVLIAPVDAHDSDALLGFKQLEVDARFWPLLKGQVSIERIALEDPLVRFTRQAGSGAQAADWNWLRLVERVKSLVDEPSSAQDDQSSSINVSIDEFVLKEGRVEIRDAQQKASYDFGPLNLNLTELRNQDEHGHVGGSSLYSRYTLNLGRVQIPLPAVEGIPNRTLSFAKVVASGQLLGNSESSLRAVLDLQLDDGALASNWQLDSKGALSGKINIRGLAVKPLLSLVPTYEKLDSLSGLIDGSVEIKQDDAALEVHANLKLDAVDIRVAGSGEHLLAWDNAVLSQLHLILPSATEKAGQLSMDEIVFENPKIRFVLDPQHYSNFRGLFSRPQPTESKTATTVPSTENRHDAASVSVPKVRQDAAVSKGPEFRYDIRGVRLKNGSMYFADESLKPAFRVRITDLNGSVQGISNAPGRHATLVLNGHAAKTGSLRARGQMAFADPRLDHDVNLVFRNIPLNATNPYVMTFAGYAIDDGRIDVDLRYVTKNGQLQGKNRFVIKKIKLGEPVADFEGSRLPLGLAIALLEDSDGMIDVNIPVQGNVNEPEFSVGHLVWQAVKTVLNNVVTAPFRALGALLGIENVDVLAFVPGESAVPLEGEEPLHKIAEYLAKHPKARLILHGTYDSAIDGPELARALADTAIFNASGIKVIAGEPLPLPNLTDPKINSGLKSAYASQVGRIKLGQRLMSLPDTPERDAQLRQELIDSYKIGDDQLKQLAAQRADAVKARLVAVEAPLADRITIGDIETVTADKAGVPIKVVLEKGS